MLKSSQDNVWHASALEGLATISILDAWSAEKTVGINISKGLQTVLIQTAP